jgi:hypothetical protein
VVVVLVQAVVLLLHQMELIQLLDLLHQQSVVVEQVVDGQALVMAQMVLLVVPAVAAVVLGLAAVRQHKEQVAQELAVKVLLVVMVHQILLFSLMLQVAVVVVQVQ